MLNNPLPIILSRPHGGMGIPSEIEDLIQIDEIALYNDCDLWIDELFDFAHEDLKSHVPTGHSLGVLETVSMPVARALIDVNRPLSRLGTPDGPVKSHTSYGVPIYREPLTDELQDTLISRYWQSYHDQIDSALSRHEEEVKLFIDCHSMAQHGPTAYHDAGQARPLICVANLGDKNGEPTEQFGWTFMFSSTVAKVVELAADLFADMSLLNPNPGSTPVALLNQPFWGSYVIVHHFHPPKLNERFAARGLNPPARIMVEVNRGLYVGDQTGQSEILEPNWERIGEIRKRLYKWACGILDMI